MATSHPAPSGDRERPAGNARRVVLAAAAALVLVGVAAVAAGGGRADDSGGISLPPVRWLIAVVFVLLLAVGTVAFAVLLLQPRERRPPSATRQLRVLVAAAAIVVVLLALVGRRPTDGTPTADDDVAPPDATTPVAAGELSSETVWRDVAILLGLVVVGAGAAVVAAGRRSVSGAAVEEDAGDAAALSDVLDDAVAALRAETDPRRAVIAAYALVERSLRFHRLPRRPSETALEYLARLLEHLDASGPAIRRLTGLFDRAMFSARDMDRAMQDEAVDALVAVRDELRAGPVHREVPR